MAFDYDDPVYYKILKDNEGVYSVVHLQWFDEPDYDSASFVSGPDGKPLTFECETHATDAVNALNSAKNTARLEALVDVLTTQLREAQNEILELRGRLK